MQDIQPAVRQANDKAFLRTIVDRDYEIPEEFDAFAFALALLENFHSSDPELRDKLSYMILARAIIEKQKLTPEAQIKLLTVVLDNQHLFYHIGEVGKDSVFMRSFSNLIIAAILYTDARNPSMPVQLIQQTREALLRYAREEQDWRGYIEGKGWAHAMAHLADALDECAQNQMMSTRDRKAILKTLSDLARLPEPLYHEEDMRLATVAYNIIACKQVDEKFIEDWLKSCYVERSTDVASWFSATNAKNFLRSLYFRLLWANISLAVLEQISRVLQRLDEIYIDVKDV